MTRPLFRLASASPRRSTIFKLVQIPFVVAPSDAEESTTSSNPASLARENARIKATASARAADGALPRHTIGADTIVVLDEAILGKPMDETEARSMLETLSGRTHEVVTGWALLDDLDVIALEHSTTQVTFRTLTPTRIDDYIRDREWTDKAGGYAIQGRGAHLIAHLSGDAFNVMGLPVGDVIEAFLAHDVIPRFPL